MGLVVVWNYHGNGQLIGVFKENDKHLERLRKEVIEKKEEGYIQFIETKLNHQVKNI
jgi:hypothetical protein